MELSELGEELLNIANKNINKTSREVHPLARYIYALDMSWDDDSVVRSIGERIGVYVPEEERDAATTLFLKLREFLQQETDISRTSRLVNATPEQYPTSYANRLLSEE